MGYPKVKPFTPNQIKRLRKKNNATQKVFSVFLNVTETTVRNWESGRTQPTSIYLKLLNIVANKGLDFLGPD